MRIYRAFFVVSVGALSGQRFSQDYYSETAMETGIANAFFNGIDYNGYIIIETEGEG